MAQKVLALNVNGDITYCTVSPDLRGRGRCNHVEHQMPGETPEEFMVRIDEKKKVKEDEKILKRSKAITQLEIDTMAKKIDSIAGVKVTQDNFKEVLSSLTPEQIAEITKISFDASPSFSLPISDEKYEDEAIKNQLYFANLPEYGISGKQSAIVQMFEKVGETRTLHGVVDIENSYSKGLTPGEYFARQFVARDAEINKSVSTSKPGYCIWEDSLVEVTDESGKLTKILWKDISIGDIFKDGSEVIDLAEWQLKPCFEIKISKFDPIVVSNDHLLYGEILLNNEPVINFEKSKKARENVQESDVSWICAEDIYEMYNLGAAINFGLNGERVSYIKPFKNLIPQRVRCITSSTGHYETNGLLHHNTARKLFYAMSDTQVFNDCKGPYIDALHCSMPEGHVCVKCAKLTKGGERVKVGNLIGGLISTNMSEALTQLSMKHKHVGTTESANQIHGSHTIMSTLDGWSNSPIIQKMRECKTTEEMRQTLFEGLKQEYKDAGIAQDDFNIQMVAKRLTSYKRTKDGLKPIKPGEKADIVSMQTIGNNGNIFKVSELSSGYKHLTKPFSQELKTDAANEILK